MVDVVKEPRPAGGGWNWKAVALVVAVLLLVGGVFFATGGDDPPGSSPPLATTPATTPVPAPPVKIDDDGSSDNEPDGPALGAHEDQRDETPSGVDENELERGLRRGFPTIKRVIGHAEP